MQPSQRRATLCILALVLATALLACPNFVRADTQSDLEAASAKLEEIGSKLSSLQGELETATSESDELDAAIASKDSEVLAAEDELEGRRDTLAETLSFDYKLGYSSLLDYVLGSTSFDDLLSRITYAQKVAEAQAEAIASVKAASEKLTQEQAELAEAQANQKAKVDELAALVKDYQAAADEATSVYNALDEQVKAELAAQESANITAAVDAANATNSAPSTSEGNDSGGDLDVEASDDSGTASGTAVSPNPGDDGSTAGSGSTSTSYGNLAATSRSRDTYLATVTWTDDDDYINALRAKAESIGSSTSYFITFDNELCRVIIFRRSGGAWETAKLYNCNGAKVTYRGTFSIRHKRICNWADSYFGMGYNDWSSDYIEGYSDDSKGHRRWLADIGKYECCAAVHGTGETTTGWANSGCCGLLTEQSKWVYDNCPVGTTVYEFCYSDLL